MRIPFDSDPPVVDSTLQTEEVFNWDDEPCVNLNFIPDYVPPISAPSTGVIIFDLFGTILDCDGAVNEAMCLLSPTHPNRCQLSAVYLECKLMRHRDNPDAPYTDFVQHVLKDVCIFLGVLLSEVLLHEVIQTILQPGSYAEAEAAMRTLLDQGYTVFSLPIPDAWSFLLPQLPSGLTTSWNAVAWHAAPSKDPDSYSDVQPLLRCLESEVKLSTSNPTLAINRLQALQMQLQTLSALHSSPVQCTPSHVKEFHICSMYQVTNSLGMGSFGNVSSTFHVLTSLEVAVKMEILANALTVPVVLPYEALVYSLLCGYLGIPSCK
ncbi:uncharacterized protein BJ212DRAFT_1481617 [Suillus subaureus]|uniref:Uncharacterized protein n=1 Tax=Suillus subaureus TaxID=48587 RepID=A0A9P7E965_9AGAM|nr:uncharacterized protein BJ212DRAFT_1481617 [Suillus subaureus]KAG1815091.1 hypothetical protein BJ212DRAFT_1481617 [Suillus subaureus]